MSQTPPEGYSRVTPYLLYKDSDAAVEFLTSAFGFEQRYHLTGADGKINHAEIEFEGGVGMLGAPQDQHRSPGDLGGRTRLVHVYVDDVDVYYEHGKRAGVAIASEPADQFSGDRTYAAQDLEGHAWTVATHIRDVPAETM